MKRIYLDYNASTPVAPEVVEAMLPYLSEYYGNPSSLHGFGRDAQMAMEKARGSVAKVLNATASEICFVSGGTEASNLAIRGVAGGKNGGHLITTKTEHKATLNSCKFLEKKGFEVTYLQPDAHGIVSPEKVAEAIRPDTILISVIHGNNETGTLNPIEAIGNLAREKKILFHTDTVQSFCKTDLDMKKMPVDLLSMSAHKIYGPKGAGALYVRRGVTLTKQAFGGGHEHGRRSGTENLPGIVGFAAAAERMMANKTTESARIKDLRDTLYSSIKHRFPEIHLNGHPDNRLYNTLNISLPGANSNMVLFGLDMKGIAVSAGSACTAGKVSASHVLTAMGLPDKVAQSAVRISLGRHTTRENIDTTVEALSEVFQKFRR